MLKKLRSKLVKTKVLEEINLNNITYRVVEKTSIVPSYSGRRALVFRVPNKNGTFIHSMIYIDKKKRYQPTFYLPQRVLDLWGEKFSLNENLCLGAAGCAVPRFLGLNFKESHTVGVEYSKEFIELAKKYFLINEIENQFDLVNADAFEYVKNENIKEKFDSVYIDIFDAEKLPQNIYGEDFINSLYLCTKENSVCVFNFLAEKPSKISEFAKSIKDEFPKKAVVYKDGRTALLLIKTNAREKANSVLEQLEKEATVVTV